MTNTQFLVITGLSGSGKTLVQDSFEDMGYFCVDNLPVKLLPVFFELCARTGDEYGRVAVVVDVREPTFLSDFPRVYVNLREAGFDVRLLFLEASEEVLIRRFHETRRPHPLAQNEPLTTGLRKEREKLEAIRNLADEIVDTSRFNTHELRTFIKNRYEGSDPDASIVLSLISFGFKYGIPRNSDLLFDVRFLPNPYFLEALRGKDGNDKEVVRFLEEKPDTHTFLESLKGFLDYLIPLFIREGKSYLTISIGCTGGKHRSVMITNALKNLLHGERISITVAHRDIAKEQ
jgi:UPF0042 nucleotide-binding protein